MTDIKTIIQENGPDSAKPILDFLFEAHMDLETSTSDWSAIVDGLAVAIRAEQDSLREELHAQLDDAIAEGRAALERSEREEGR